MPGFTWLASYPKSGNTWFRMVTANLYAEDNEPVDINDLPERGGIASARAPFDNILLLESGILTHEECDRMRPMLYQAMAQEDEADFDDPMQKAEDEDRIDSKTRLIKCHDAWTYTDRNEPLLGGANAANSAILIVRDPRDVAPSLANHLGSDIDSAIAFMGKNASPFCGSLNSQPNQLRQQMLGWSGHATSWLDQRDIPVHLIRYEQLKADPVGTIHGALSFAGRTHSMDDVANAVELASFERLQAQEAASKFREAPKGRTFFRRGESGAWRDELTPEQIAQVERDHAVMMKRMGYEPS